MDAVLQDLKHSLRICRRNPGFTFAALLALSLGIGANTAIFSVVDAILLRPLPYPDPDRLVQILGRGPWGSYPYTSVPRFNAYRAQSQIFQDVAAYEWQGGSAVNLTGGDRPEQLRGERVSHEYFRLFGARFLAGRAFTPQEDSPGGGSLAVISGGLWQRRFASDPQLVGKAILLGGDPYTVVGIVSPAVASDPPVDVWLPLQAAPNSTDHATYFYVVARMRPGVTLDQANAALQLAAVKFRSEFPDGLGKTGSFTAEPLQRSLTGEVRPALLVLLGAVVCLLSIACANVASLLLARSTGRAREMAIRAAVGAGRWRIVRQLLTESGVLSLLGGACGLIVAVAGVRALLFLSPGEIANGLTITLDLRVLAFTLLLSILTGFLFGAAPAFHAARVDLDVALRESGVRSGARRHNATRGAIIVAEVAIAVLLLTGAGLLMRTYIALQRVAPGFDPRNVLTLESALTGSRLDRTADIAMAVNLCAARIAAIPGVTAVAAASSLPLEANTSMAFRIAGRPLADRPFHGAGWWRYVTPGYFGVYKIPILRGRAFTARDDAAAPPVVLINATMARQYWPDADPIGQQIRLDSGNAAAAEPYREVVGVVADVRELGLQQEDGSAMYVPLPQVLDKTMAIQKRIGPLLWTVRAGVPPASISAAVQHEIQRAAGISTGRVRSMDQVLWRSTARHRFNSALLVVVAGIAVLLAAIGLYSLIAYSIGQRTREFGIRLALGAESRQLRNLIVRQAMTFTLFGIGIGLAAALALTRLMASLLFGVRPNDLPVFLFAACSMAAVALFASLLPARRTARVDPVAALRSE